MSLRFVGSILPLANRGIDVWALVCALNWPKEKNRDTDETETCTDEDISEQGEYIKQAHPLLKMYTDT